MSAIDCTEFRDRAPELALGLLGGDERGDAIEHLSRCATCGIHLQELMRVADLLLQLAPAVEPDVGFESRIMARLAAEGAFVAGESSAEGRPGAAVVAAATPTALRPTRSVRPAPARRWWPRLVAAAAAVVIVAVAATIGVAAGRDSGRASAYRVQAGTVNQLATRAVVVRADGGRSLCQLVAFPAQGSQAARLVVHLNEPAGPPDTYQVYAEPSDGGPAVALGTITMIDGQGTLTASVPAGTGPVHAVRIVEAPNTVKYRATFAPV